MEGKKYFAKNDVFVFNEQIINRWKPSSEVWPYAYGNDILGLMSAFGGFFTTHFLRKELKIRPYARMTCYVPAVGLPAVGCYIFQSYVITSDILSKNGCPLCITTKSSLAQAIFGVAFPVTLSSVACFNVADRLLTYPIPPILKAPKEIFQLFQRLVQKRTRAFSIICAINIIAASFITHQKQNVLVNLDLVPRKKDLFS